MTRICQACGQEKCVNLKTCYQVLASLNEIHHPTKEDHEKAEEFLFGHLPSGTLYNDQNRKDIKKLAHELMMRRILKQ